MKDRPNAMLDPEFGKYAIIFERQSIARQVCYFVGFSFFTDYPDYVYFYLSQLNESDLDIIFISCSELTDTSITELKKYCTVIIEKENKGIDFGAWRVALAYTNFGSGYDSVILANDSMFGPFRSLKYDLQNLATEYDLWGYSASLEIEFHVQSYFLCCSNKLITSDFWRSFWEKMVFISDKDQLIRSYEVGFSQQVLSNGFNIGAFADSRNLKKKLNTQLDHGNYTIFTWKDLILQYNFPFLKRELLIKEIAQATNAGWKAAILKTFAGYDTGLIDSFIKSFASKQLNTENTRFYLRRKEIFFLTYFKNNISDDQLLALQVAEQIGKTSGEQVICFQLTSGKSSAVLNNLDASGGVAYAGLLNIGLVNQYIYHWNRYNVRALIIDRPTFNMFRHYWVHFYSGDIFVIGKDDDNNALLDHYIRTEVQDSVCTPMLNTLSHATGNREVVIKAEVDFVNSYSYLAVKHSLQNLQVLVVEDPPTKAGSLLPETKQFRNTAVHASALTISLKNGQLILAQDEGVLLTNEDPDIFCNLLGNAIEERYGDKRKINNALRLPIIDTQVFLSFIDSFISHKEINICRSPKTSSFTHIYYEDSLYEILPYLYNLSLLNDHQFFFSISEDTFNKHEIAKILKMFFPGCRIQIVRNTGKDIGGKLILLKLYFELELKSDFMLFLHDKKSMHSYTVDGDTWRNDLFKIAEPDPIVWAFSMFEENSRLGMIGNKKWLNNTDFNYHENRFVFHDAFLRKKIQEYKITVNDYKFVGGTMFWVREAIMRSFFKKYSLFDILAKLENGNILDSKDGTETHFLERLFGWFTTFENYELSGI